MRRLFTILVVAAAACAPGAAWAQGDSPSDSDRVTARALAHDGYEAQKRGQYEEAADRFRRADALVHAPTLELGLARAEVGLGKLVEAHETYRRIVREVLPPGAPAPFGKAVEDAKKELSALEPRLAWVTIDVRGPAAPDVTVTVDGALQPSAILGIRRASDPGRHVARVSASGFAPAERTFTVAEGEATEVGLSLTALPEAPAPTPPPSHSAETAAPASTPPSSGSFMRTAGWTALGIGVVGLVGGGVTGVLALNKHASLSGGCPDGHCAPSDASAVSQYNTLATISTVAVAAGAVGVVGGAALLLAAPKQASVTAYAGFLSAGVMGSF